MANWFSGEEALVRITRRRLGSAFEAARPRLERMGALCATDGARWAHEADRYGPKLVTHDRSGARVDEIEYHPAYRQLQQLGYGGGIVAATYDPALARERGEAPKSLTFALGYLFSQAEAGMYCPVTMTDGAAHLLRKFGSKALQDRFIPRLASTDLATLYTGAMFLTEKEGGSDVGQARTIAKGSGDEVRLYGDKWFCSNVDADVIMILARPEGAVDGTRGLGLYVLPRTLPNGQRNAFRVERLKEKLGERSFPTGEVTLDGASAYLLGGPGEGFHQMTDMLNVSRLYNAAASVACMRRAVVEAMAWSEERVAFGRRIIEHPLQTEQLLDMACEQRVALNWLFRGVELMDKVEFGTPATEDRRTLRTLTPLLKYTLGKKAVSVVSEGVEALGGNGYIEDWPLARVLRDAHVLPIWEGTSNILVLDAFRALRKEAGHELVFAEIERGAADAPRPLHARLGALLDELKSGLVELRADPHGEHTFRDWADRAALLWSVANSVSKRAGFGHETDLRAAARVLERAVPSRLLRSDRATVEGLRAVVWG